MKKTYINPTSKVYSVQPSNMMANSPQTLSSGGSNSQSGAPNAAEAREWRGSSSVMGNEW